MQYFVCILFILVGCSDGKSSMSPLATSTHEKNIPEVVADSSHICYWSKDKLSCHAVSTDDYRIQLTPNGLGLKKLTTGYQYACGIWEDDGIKCWGDSASGVLDVPILLDPTDIVGGEDSVCAISPVDGIKCWGGGLSNITMPEITSPKMIAVGKTHACSLDTNQNVKCWGAENNESLKIPPLKNPTIIAAGSNHTCALEERGILCWGLDRNGSLDAPKDLINPQKIFVGDGYTCAKDNKGPRCWGEISDIIKNDLTQPGMEIIGVSGSVILAREHDLLRFFSNDITFNLAKSVGDQSITDVFPGFLQTCFKTKNNLECRGKNDNKQHDFDKSGDIRSVIFGVVRSVCIQKNGGYTCHSTPPGSQDPVVTIPKLSPKTEQLGLGISGGCALDNGVVRCWGFDRSPLLNIPNLKNPTVLATGIINACQANDEEVVCWGDIPSRLPLKNTQKIVIGIGWQCALSSLGSVSCWGRDSSLDILNVPHLKHVTDIAAGAFHVCALDDGQAKCWGSNTLAQLDVPPLVHPRSIYATAISTCVLDDSGLVCWGEGKFRH